MWGHVIPRNLILSLFSDSPSNAMALNNYPDCYRGHSMKRHSRDLQDDRPLYCC